MDSASSSSRYASVKSDMNALGLECHQDRLHAVANARRRGVYSKLGIRRRLVWLRYAGEIGNPAVPRGLVQTLGVARLAHGERGIQKDLQEFSLAHELPSSLAIAAERRNESRDHEDARVEHEFGRFSDATDILDAVCLGKCQVAA